jgi:hypothetical protein
MALCGKLVGSHARPWWCDDYYLSRLLPVPRATHPRTDMQQAHAGVLAIDRQTNSMA